MACRANADGSVDLCEPLAQALEDGRGKGLHGLTVFRDGHVTTGGIRLRSGGFEGILINFCPFCGAELDGAVKGVQGVAEESGR